MNASSKKNVAFNDEFFAFLWVEEINNGFVQCNSHVDLKNTCNALSASMGLIRAANINDNLLIC